MKKRRAPPPPGQLRNRSIDLDQSDVTDTYFDNQPVVHESPFNLQPIMVLGCKGKIQIEQVNMKSIYMYSIKIKM